MYSPSANEPPERPRKKIMIQLDNDFPMMQTPPYQDNQDSTSIRIISNYSVEGTMTTMSEDAIQEMNEKFKAQLKDIKEAQEIKLTEFENKLHLELQASITTAVENSVQIFSQSIATIVEISSKEKMDVQIQPSLEWIKAQITATNNSMALHQHQMLQAVQQSKEENAKVIQQVQEENTQREEHNFNTMNKMYAILEGMRENILPQTSFSSSNQGLSGTRTK
eukprot:5214213-Ditylum_brightwellii.AAC.1